MAPKTKAKTPDELLDNPKSKKETTHIGDDPFSDNIQNNEDDFFSKIPEEVTDLEDFSKGKKQYTVMAAKRGEGQEIDMPATSYGLVRAGIHQAWRTKQGILLFGDSGIGKSSILEATTREIASYVKKVIREYLEPDQKAPNNEQIFHENVINRNGLLITEDVWNFDEIDIVPGSKVKNTKTGEFGVVKSVKKTGQGISIDVTPSTGGKESVLQKRFYLKETNEPRTYINFNEASEELIDEILEQPGKFFVYINKNAIDMDPIVSIMGVPKIRSKRAYLETQQEAWIHIFRPPESAGILFIDELNRGSQEILNSFLPLVLDRKVHQTKLRGNFNIVAAGNFYDEMQGTRLVPNALIKRFRVGTLVVSPEDFIEYAEHTGAIEPEIISFLRSQPNMNFRTAPDPSRPEDPMPTPRGLSEASKILADYKKNLKQIQAVQPRGVHIFTMMEEGFANVCGLTWARNFIAFLKNMKLFSLSSLYKERKDLSNYDGSKVYAVLAYTAQQTINILKREPLTDQDKIQLVSIFDIVYETGAEKGVSTENVTQYFSLMRLYARNMLNMETRELASKWVGGMLSAPVEKKRLQRWKDSIEPIMKSMQVSVEDVFKQYLEPGK